jgi:RecA-family ATPase
MGKDWLGMPVKRGPVLYIGCEDDERELQIRLMVIAKHYGVTFKDLERNGLHVWAMCDRNAVLVEPGERGSGRMVVTNLYRELKQFCADVRPVSISLDTLSHVFAGNEIARTEVYAFATYMRALARTAGGSLTVLAHPSLAGIATGTGISGSTAWHGAFRFRQFLTGHKKSEDDDQPDTNKRVLEFKKNQYGPLGASIELRYQDGLFLPVAGITIEEREEADDTAEGLFMALLTRYLAQGRSVHHSNASIHYAPKIFAKDEEAERHGVRMKGFEAAMRRLFAAGKVKTVPYGRPSKGGTRLEPVV